MVSSLDKARPSHRSTSSRSSRAKSPALWTEWSGIVQLPHQNNGFGPCPSTLAFLSNYCGFPTGISTVPISEDCTRMVPGGGGCSPLEGGGRPVEGGASGAGLAAATAWIAFAARICCNPARIRSSGTCSDSRMRLPFTWHFRASRPLPPWPALFAWVCTVVVSQCSPSAISAASFSVRASMSAESSKSGLKRSPPFEPCQLREVLCRFRACRGPRRRTGQGPRKGPGRGQPDVIPAVLGQLRRQGRRQCRMLAAAANSGLYVGHLSGYHDGIVQERDDPVAGLGRGQYAHAFVFGRIPDEFRQSLNPGRVERGSYDRQHRRWFAWTAGDHDIPHLPAPVDVAKPGDLLLELRLGFRQLDLQLLRDPLVHRFPHGRSDGRGHDLGNIDLHHHARVRHDQVHHLGIGGGRQTGQPGRERQQLAPESHTLLLSSPLSA